MSRRWLLVAIALCTAMVVVACSGDYNRYPDLESSPTTTTPRTTTTTSSSTTTTTTTTTSIPPGGNTTTTAPGATTTTSPPPPGVPPGRLAVVTADGSLVTVRADGAEVTTIADPPSGGTNVQVAWSPDASRLVFSATTRTEASIGVSVVGTPTPTIQPITTAPYLLSWDPTQARIGFLRVDSVNTVELASVDRDLTSTPIRMRSGAPVAAAWSPDGSRLVAMIGENELSLVQPSGAASLLGVRPAPAGVPAWLDGHTILVGIRTDTDQRLVKLDVDTGARQDLLVYDGAITFLPDPAGTRLAYQVVPQSGGGGAGGRVSYPFPQTQPTTPPDAAQGELTVLDLANGQSTRVVDHSVQAFQWSPDGSRLAFLDSESSGASRWRFWSPSAIVDGVVFMPSPTFVELIEPYFDQLATSARWWSPDSSAFTFAGRIQGRDGVWALPIGATSPTLVHDGELSTWSPR